MRRQAHVSLTCVLDRSGSMAGSRLKLVAETCHFLVDQLGEDDMLSLVSYSGTVRVDLPLLRMTGHAKALAHRVVEGIQADGSTALYDGLYEGLLGQLQVGALCDGLHEGLLGHLRVGVAPLAQLAL